MKEKTKAYFAGIFDAEGSIYIYKGRQKYNPKIARYSMVLSVANDSLALMNWIIENFGGSFRHRIVKGDSSYEWTSKNLSHMSSVLDLIIPHLVIKKSQAFLAQDFINLKGEMNPAKRDEIYNKMLDAKSLECVTTNTSGNFSRPYFAGLLDGEGYVRVYRYPRKSPRRYAYMVKLNIINSEKNILELGKSVYGGAIYPVKKIKLAEKQRYCWEITNNPTREKFLLSCLPYLIVKREQAKTSLDFLRIPKYSQAVEQRELLYNRSERLMIESKLNGNVKSVPVVTQDT